MPARTTAAATETRKSQAFQGGSGVYLVDLTSTALYHISDAVGFGGMDWTP